MTIPIQGPGGSVPILPVQPAGSTPAVGVAGGKGFRQVLMDNLNEVNRLQQEADQKVQALYRGDTNNVAEVFAAVNKAGVAFDLLMEIRNKMVEAYQEIQQMRV
ncbi:MAG: flagellar hook-basal body complex protein FliE [Phycisphaerae bacterium]|nr:flagellar hook-basal body complex protein FliE [Phycisphaerae bacterium]